ncbi:Glutathione reductase, partial [Tulasnella sp. 408]
AALREKFDQAFDHYISDMRDVAAIGDGLVYTLGMKRPAKAALTPAQEMDERLSREKRVERTLGLIGWAYRPQSMVPLADGHRGRSGSAEHGRKSMGQLKPTPELDDEEPCLFRSTRVSDQHRPSTSPLDARFTLSQIRNRQSVYRSLSNMPPVVKPEATTDKYDYVVLGGGSGGVASARRAASYGKKVALIESTGRLGGTCVNVGCVPKKIMWYAADAAERLRNAASYGFANSVDTAAPAKFDWDSFKPKRDAYIKRLNGIYDSNLTKENVEYHVGYARIKDPNTVEITAQDGTKYELKTEYIGITTGGRPLIPSDEEVPGASLGVSSDGFFDLPSQPKRVAVIGAGYIAVELTGIFNALGSEAHIFTRGETVLRTFDEDIQKTLTP